MKQGLGWAFRFLVLSAATGTEDADLAWRYRRLGLLPEHTLGRRYWAHMRENRFAFPGEIGGAPEFAVQHDITHVLADYATDPAGELQIGVFTAGMKKEDPFTFCFGAMLQFHAGLKIHPLVAPATGNFDPETFARAHERGSRMKIDLTAGTWDHWPHMERPAEDVARELGISD
jgi:ubiquinone biosynthesis protein Coq4